MHPVKLFERAASTAAHTLRHPLSSAAYTAGIARGLVGAALHGATTTGHDPEAGPRPVPAQRSTYAAPEAPTPTPAEAVISPPEPAPPGEQFATEPKAVSRDSEHGGPATDAEIDAWIDEAMARGTDVDVETPVGTTGADVGHNPDTAEADLQQPGTPPLLDPSVAKAIRSESEMLRKDAERDPE